ncbi:hypothetical protein FCULG_00005116 [Fusarium culmorum]|uniref:Uncharacterized protein n=1 Tax=Fusarium culmorum TaxID=5516 RepID=A0A2T4HB80_FUSCU|nr:hypothetical protein FCULG_00005116 [Fusarium culmorum]
MDAVKKVFPFHLAAWQVATTTIDAAVNEPNEYKRDRMIQQWRTAMLAQLSNVEIIGAIMSATIVGAFTWPSLESLSPWPIPCSLVLGVGAVALSLQQSVFLMRIGCLPQANAMCRRMLSRDIGLGQRIPRWDQVILWQTAVGLLEFSIYTWLGGFIAFVGDTTYMGLSSPGKGNQVVGGTIQADSRKRDKLTCFI